MGTRACTWPACPGAPVASTCSHLQTTSSHFRETKSRPCSFADAVPSSQSAFPSCHCRPSSSNWGSCLSVLQPRAPPMGALSEGKSRPPMATHPASHKGANTQGAEAPGCSRDPGMQQRPRGAAGQKKRGCEAASERRIHLASKAGHPWAHLGTIMIMTRKRTCLGLSLRPSVRQDRRPGGLGRWGLPHSPDTHQAGISGIIPLGFLKF